jgi:hypothetical protein
VGKLAFFGTGRALVLGPNVGCIAVRSMSLLPCAIESRFAVFRLIVLVKYILFLCFVMPFADSSIRCREIREPHAVRH